MTNDQSMRQAAEYAASLRLSDVPDSVCTVAEKSLEDALGCAMGAHATSLGSSVVHAAARLGGGANVVLGAVHGASAPTAAWINALLVNMLDFDDTYGSHLSATVVPVCLAAAELADSDGPTFLAGLIVAYEMSSRLGVSLIRQHPRSLLHGHGTWQGVGATFGAARILGLSSEATLAAVAMSASHAPIPSVMKTVYGDSGPTDSKNNFGSASAAAVTSSVLAAEGMTAPHDMFYGETGFWRMIGCDTFESGRMLDGLGETFRLTGIGYKPYPACRLIQSTLTAVVSLMDRGRIDANAIRSIHVESVPILASMPFANARPTTMSAAQYSLPYAVAAVLLRRAPGPGWYSEDALRDEELLSLADRVRVTILDDASIPGHPSDVPTRVRIELETGKILVEDERIAYGDSRRPLSLIDFVGKFDANLASAALGLDSDELRRGLAGLRGVESMRRWAALHLVPVHS